MKQSLGKIFFYFFFLSVKDENFVSAKLGEHLVHSWSASGGVQRWLISLFSLDSRGSKRLLEWPAQPLCLPADHPPEGRPEPGYQRSLWWAWPFSWFPLKFTWLFFHWLQSGSSWLLFLSLIQKLIDLCPLPGSEHSTIGFIHLRYTGEGAALCSLLLWSDCAAAKHLLGWT